MTKIIAELSSNHNGDLCRCLDMIDAAKKAGCWAAKFQLYKPEDLPDFDPNVNFPIPSHWLPHMRAVAGNLLLFASVFAPWAVEETKEYVFFKVASPESTRLSEETYRTIRYALPYQAIVFVSSGRADFDKMQGIFCDHRYTRMLYCKSGYPATIDIEDVQFMAKNAVGFSDHTAGILGSLAMAAAGAQYIEKHFKLDDNCVDAAFSLNPDQMKVLCDLVS